MTYGNPETMGESWYAAMNPPAPARPSLGADLDVEVCVIGGGLAGLTAAYEIARRGWSVTVIEARRIAWNASGRNCGFVVPGFAEDIRRVVSRVGLERAKEMWTLSEGGVEYVRDRIAKGMPDVEVVDGWLDVSRVDRGDELLPLVGLLGQEFGAEIEGWPLARVREVIRSERYFHGIHYPRAFHINPLAYAHGLAAAAEEAGARIFEETPAVEIDPAGVRKRVTTPNARVRAAHVVLAGNVHLGAVMPRIGGTVMPVGAYVAVTGPLGHRLHEAIRYRGGVGSSHLADDQFRIVAEDRLLWASTATWKANPRWRTGAVRAAIARNFPQLDNLRVEYIWSGVMGRALHGMPQIGEVSPGLWLASGFSGHGLNTTAMAGRLIADAIVETDDRWRLFTPYELSWAGGFLGSAVAQAYSWGSRVGRRIGERNARKRDFIRRRSAVE